MIASIAQLLSNKLEKLQEAKRKGLQRVFQQISGSFRGKALKQCCWLRFLRRIDSIVIFVRGPSETHPAMLHCFQTHPMFLHGRFIATSTAPGEGLVKHKNLLQTSDGKENSICSTNLNLTLHGGRGRTITLILNLSRNQIYGSSWQLEFFKIEACVKMQTISVL